MRKEIKRGETPDHCDQPMKCILWEGQPIADQIKVVWMCNKCLLVETTYIDLYKEDYEKWKETHGS